jgi:YfiH family protein
MVIGSMSERKTASITVPAFAEARDGVCHFFGTRHGSEKLMLSEKTVVVAVTQVHGTDVLALDRPVTGPEAFNGDWDALITNQPHVLLTIRTADCVPVLVLDPVHRVVAAVHAGWRGAVGGIVGKTFSLMRRRFGSDPQSLRVSIGPSAGPCCYEVDGPVLSRLRKAFADWRSVVRESGKNKAMLDLRALVRCQAEALGVSGEEVHKVSLCTICNPDLFYSYRREGAVKATMVSGIMLTR